MKRYKFTVIILSVVAVLCFAFIGAGCATDNKITPDKEQVEIYVGETATVKAETNSDGALVWKSGDTDIATVEQDGTITAVGAGETTVTVTAGSASASIAVKVTTRPEFTLSHSHVSLEKYDDITVSALLDGEIASAEWSSDNTAVASVADGTVTAVSAGFATVTAKIGDRTMSLGVTVTESGIYPTVAAQTGVALNVGKTFAFNAKVNFNAKLKDGGEFTYKVKDAEIATVDGAGVITGVKKGSTTLTVGGSWKGMSLLPVEIELTVSDDIIYHLESNSVSVATSDRGEAHKNTFALAPAVTVNGSAVNLSDCTFTVTDPEIATVDGSGVITGLKEGETTVSLRYNGDGAYPATVKVNVYIPVLKSEVTEAIALEALRVDESDKASIENVFGLTEAVKINFGGKDVPAALSGNKILFDGAKVDKFGKREVTVYSDKVGYTFPMDIVSMNIGSAADLATITRLNTADTVDGIYYVTADIDASDAGIVRLVNNNTVSYEGTGRINTDKGFKGTFDGRGHIISNLTTAGGGYRTFGGLFGNLASGSKVMNVAFVDMTSSDSNFLFVGDGCGMFGTVENVVVTTAKISAKVFASLTNGTLNSFMAVGVAQIDSDGSGTAISNIMSVTANAASGFGGFSWTGNDVYNAQPNYATVEAMLEALESENKLAAWNSPITYNNGAIYFNGTKIIE